MQPNSTVQNMGWYLAVPPDTSLCVFFATSQAKKTLALFNGTIAFAVALHMSGRCAAESLPQKKQLPKHKKRDAQKQRELQEYLKQRINMGKT